MNRLTGRPTADSIPDATKYTWLSEAQMMIVTDVAGICPNVLYPPVAYGSIPACITTDSQTFTFGTDANGYAIAPMGKVAIYSSLNDIPSNPWRAGADYIPLGGTAIQIPNNNSYSGTLYWRGITPPPAMNATTQPVLFPEGSRQLIAYRAAIAFLTGANRNAVLAAELKADYGRPFGANPGLFANQLLEWRSQFRGGGVLGSLTGLQVATGSAFNANAGF